MNKFTLSSSAKSKKMPSGCWEYRGTIEKRGYGVLEVDRRQWRAHRYMYVQTHGPVSDDLYICHKCDNRLCVNPDHLWLGSLRDNAIDMARKRRAGGQKIGPDTAAIIKADTRSYSLISEQFGISLAQISRIKSGTRFGYINHG